jgi:predicted Zn-dependent peptidase
MYRLPIDHWDGYQARMMAVTPADVRRVARQYPDPKRLRVVAVGDVPRIRDGLRDVGVVETYGADGQGVP